MRHAVETGTELWEQHRCFAWHPTQIDGRWLWLQPYWLVVHHWGWGFSDEWRFRSEHDADACFDARHE
jgi:hypothetical protein